MVKLQMLPEEVLSLQVLNPIIKTGVPTIVAKRITENGKFSAKEEGATGFDPVEVAVDLTPAYDEGYNQGKKDGYETGAKEGAEVGYAKGEAEGYNKGVAETEAKNAWIPYTTTAEYLFSQAVFPADTELVFTVNPVIVNMTYFARQSKNLKTVKLICDWQPAKPETATMNMHQAFAYCTFETIDLTQFPVYFGNGNMTFAYNTNLKEVLGVLDLSRASVITNMFLSCSRLETVRFTPGTIKQSLTFANSPYLTDETIQSVIDGLADLTGTTAQSLTLPKDLEYRLTPEQEAAISNKNWTLVRY